MPEGAPRPALARCPECGTPAGEGLAPLSELKLARLRRLPIVALLFAIGALIVAFGSGVRTIPMRPPSFYLPNAPASTRYLSPPFTADDLRAIAAHGPGSRPGLINALLACSNDWLVQPPGKESLIVTFADRSGIRSESRDWGWPFAIVGRSSYGNFADAIDGLGRPVPVPPPLRGLAALPSMSFYAGCWRIELGSAGRDRQLFISLPALATSACVVLAAWYLASAVALMIARAKRDSQLRWHIRLPALAAAAAAIAIIALSLRPHDDRTAAFPSVGVSTRPTTLDRAALQSLAVVPDGDAQAAEAIVDACSGVSGSYLAAAFEPETVRGSEITDVSSYLQLFSRERVERWFDPMRNTIGLGGIPSAASQPRAAEWPPAPATIRLHQDELQFSPARPAPANHIVVYIFEPTTIGACIFLLWLTWLISRLICARITAALIRRRARNDLCLKCAYPLR